VKIMPTFLDVRTSQGTKAGVVSTTPLADYVAGIGLIVNTATNIRVDLEATVGVLQPISLTGSSITLTVERTTVAGLTTPGAGTPVFTQTFGIPPIAIITPFTFSLSAADIVPAATDPGAPGQLTYALFASTAAAGLLAPTYNGLQNLIGTAAGD
jgi:hypothetical protein